MKIVIVTDGNNLLGLGHVYQSITLANLLSEFSKQIIFLTKSEERICQLIIEAGFKTEILLNDDEILIRLKELNPDRVIFDKLDVAPELAHKIKAELKTKLIIFTNLTHANQYADMTVMAGMGSNFKNIKTTNESGRVDFLGPKYWLLRPEFYEFKKKKKTPNSEVKNIMLMFGGSDPANMSSFVLDEILKISQVDKVLLVLGGSFKFQEELQKIIEKNKSTKCQLRIVQNLSNVSEEMYQHDVVFCSPGLSLYEALMVGTPVVGFHQNKMQQEVHQDLLKTYGLQDMAKVSSIILNKTFIFPSDEIIRRMEIGEGREELINEILN